MITEFYSSLEVVGNDSEEHSPYIMLFRLKNLDHLVTPKRLTEWLEFDSDGLVDPPRG